MQLDIGLTETDLRQLVREHVQDKTGFVLDDKDIKIMVKTTQNYKAEWEAGKFRATISKHM